MPDHVRNAWYLAAWEHDLGPEQTFAITILDEPIVIWRTKTGRLAALVDRCLHRLAPLSLGRCEDQNLRCMYHGIVFDPEGEVVAIPGQDKIPSTARVARYPVCGRHGFIWIWMGHPALADTDLIPPAIGVDNDDFIWAQGQMDYAAEASLIHDNLCDLGHAAYVHQNTFRTSEAWALIPPQVKAIDRGIRVTRWLPAESGVPVSHRNSEADMWTSYDFLVPGVMLLKQVSYPAGTAARYGNIAPPGDDLPHIGLTVTSQTALPMARGSSRYFFCTGLHRDFGTEQLRDMILDITKQAFNEDVRMIEAQQRNFNAFPNVRVMPIVADKALLLYERLAQKMAREEARAGSGSMACV